MEKSVNTQSLAAWKHKHDFVSLNHSGERRTYYVLCLTLVMMVAEIVAGTVFGSMALLADGWHMGTHAAAFMITIGNDVWFGANVTVCPGVSIGDNVVVGAGSVVVKDLPSNSVCVGSPAKPIRCLKEGERK